MKQEEKLVEIGKPLSVAVPVNVVVVVLTNAPLNVLIPVNKDAPVTDRLQIGRAHV